MTRKWRTWLKRFLVGRALAAVRRARHVPLLALRAELAERADRRQGRIPPPGQRRRDVRSVVCFISGPGRARYLFDSIESVLASDGGEVQVIVVDDCAVDAREAEVRSRFPEVEVIRRRFPTGGPPRTWPQTRLGIEFALAHYEFEQWVKMDSDALVVGPRFSESTLARFEASPGSGLAGSLGTRADGAPEDRDTHPAVLAREVRGDRILAAAQRRAREQDWSGHIVQGGLMCLTRQAADAVVRDGWIEWYPKWHSVVSDDLALSLFVMASDFQLLSIGDPGGIVAVANKHLPLSKEELANGRWVACHSTRVGLAGESEDDLRDYFRAARSDWSSPSSAAGAAASSGPAA
jgi:hypothetical protein